MEGAPHMKTIRWQMVMEGAGEIPGSFRSPADIAADLHKRGIAQADREHFVVYLLDVKHRPIAFEVVTIGILDGSLIHPREVFKAAVCANAAAVILAHNHPSGDPNPSEADKDVTRRLRSAGEILGIPVVDHVIVGPVEFPFYSFREDGGAW
jgi:DNA repair protein RadC